MALSGELHYRLNAASAAILKSTTSADFQQFMACDADAQDQDQMITHQLQTWRDLRKLARIRFEKSMLYVALPPVPAVILPYWLRRRLF